MRTMPDKPDTWARIVAAISNPLWQGMIMAIVVSLLRILYDAKETSKRRILFEALICGSLSLVASSLIEWMTWPPSFEASDMAKWFPELLANMGSIGITGMDAVTQLGAMLQVQMKT
ncbi:phage holin family protein, partial [Pseudomonas syringae]|uniref:phage holin family protein n=2 Tax=Pseudomonas syringae TaxID=317 RepID=UPI000D8BAF24